MQPLSLVVITKNAESHLQRCLASVPMASDIVVVDSGSTDQTLALARQLGARVYSEEWRGFGKQKQRATELALHDWVLNLDADEALSPEALAEVTQLLSENPGSEAYALPRLSFHLGRWIRHGGWYPDYQVRLYDRRRVRWSDAQIHEKIECQRRPARLHSPILHWVFKDLSDQVATNNRYSTLGSETLLQKSRGFVLIQMIIRPKIKFLEVYIWKRGFLDGMPGLIIAVGAAYSVFLKWAKYWEKSNRLSS